MGSLPLPQLRAVAALGPALIDACGVIGPEQREAIVRALECAEVTERLRGMASSPPQAAVRKGFDTSLQATPLERWVATPGGFQSTNYASYRLGGDGTLGVSALVSCRPPGLGGQSGSISFTIDIGLSLVAATGLGETALLWRDGLILTSVALPEALAEIIPADAEVLQGEIHVLAANMDGNGASRPNQLVSRLNLSALGSPTREPGPSMGFAMAVAGAPSKREVAEFVAEAIEQMALAQGYLDPRIGVAALRSELGVARTSSA